MRHELDTPGWQQLERLDLQREVCEVGRNGKLQEEKRPKSVIGEKSLGAASVNEYTAEYQPPDPNDGAAEIQWAGLHHFVFVPGYLPS
jgi:hypothetical protein